MEKQPENLACLLEHCADQDPGKTLYIYNGEEIKAEVIREKAHRLSHALRSLGILPGSRVLLMMPNSPEYMIAYYAILMTGTIVVPVNVMLREREIHFLMEDCEARAIIADARSSRDVLNAAASLGTLRHVILNSADPIPDTLKLADLIESHDPADAVAEVAPHDTAVILYTAGSTGYPKGAELSHRALLGNARIGVNLLRVRSKDRVLGVLPFTHAFGQTAVMNVALASCATVILLEEFDAVRTMQAVQDFKVTLFVATPSMYRLILIDPQACRFDFSSVRYCISGGSALKPELLHSFEEQFSTVIFEGYGLCETTAIATFNHLHRERRPGSIGTPVETVEIKLVDGDGNPVSAGKVGEIAVRSDFLMKGYLHHPEATREVLRDGWFYTGDMARQDENGFFYIIDRKTDMIVKGGFNIYPVEIEQLLLDHPSIKEAAVIGVPDDVQGEEIKACIVLHENAELTAAQLADYCHQHLARYKCPRFIRFYQQLPRNPMGRISKSKLRAMSHSSER